MALNLGGEDIFGKKTQVRQDEPSILKSQIQTDFEQAARNETQIIETAFASPTVSTIHTVTAGKTFYLTHANMNIITHNTSSSPVAVLKAGSDTLMQLEISKQISGSELQSAHMAIPFTMPIKVAASTNITIEASQSSTTARATIMGWEENA